MRTIEIVREAEGAARGDGGSGLAAAAAAAVGAAGDDAGSPAGGAARGAPEGQSTPGASGAPYAPEGLPEQFRGQSERETIDKLYAAVAGRPKPPATPKDYKLELSAEMQAKFGDLRDDKVLPLWGEVAHELGLDNAGYSQAFEKLYVKMDRAGLIDHGPDYQAELEKLKPARGSDVERLRGASRRINEASAFVKGLEGKGALSKTQAAILTAVMDTADGVMTMEALAKAMGGTGIVGGGLAPEAYSEADFHRDLKDERYSTTSPKHDPAWRKAVDEKALRLPRKRLLADGRVA